MQEIEGGSLKEFVGGEEGGSGERIEERIYNKKFNFLY